MSKGFGLIEKKIVKMEEKLKFPEIWCTKIYYFGGKKKLYLTRGHLGNADTHIVCIGFPLQSTYNKLLILHF